MPQYENLTLDIILDFGMSFAIVADSLPIMREIRKMPRGYICNVIYTRIGEQFSNFVKKACNERNAKLMTSHNTSILLDPRIAAAYEASGFVS